MNQIMDVIKCRRSRREFLDKDIADGDIEKIIEAGRYAPSALNQQPWKFIVITNKDAIKKLSSIARSRIQMTFRLLPVLRLFKPALKNPYLVGAIKKTALTDADTVFYEAPLLIIIASSKRSLPYTPKDCALASQNMMLYAHSIGISSCFIGRGDFLTASKPARDIMGLPADYTIQSAIVFGYAPQSTLSVPDRKKDNLINWVR